MIGFKSGLTDCPGVATPIQLQVIKPTASFVAPANSVCDGSNLILTATGTDAVEYRFFVDNTTTPVQDWSAQNTFDYTYTSANNGQVVYVQSRSVQGCTSDIVTGPTMTVNPLPTSTLSLSATSSNPVCANEAVTFEAATDFGDTFQFLMNGVPVAGTTGNSFTINSSDIVNPVTVLVTNSATGCAMLSNEINMTVNPLPLAGISASPGIEVINGMTVTFTGTGGVEYQFDVNSTPGIDQAFSTDDTFDSSTLIAGDIVTVTVRDANGCENTASLTMSVLAEIESKIVTANPNAYCIGENGVSIYVKDPQPMVTYELIRVDDGMELGVGVLDGTRVLWTNVKNTTVGDNTYRVVGYYLSVPSAPKVNIGETVIKLYDNPIQFNMSPNEVKTDCNNGAGYEITLDGSESGVIYELYIDNSPSGVERTSDDADVNGIISFGSTEFGGSYTIYGRWENLNTCGMFMNGELRIDVPGTAYYVVSDRTDGLYCQGDVGVAISLSDSDLGVEYFLTMNGSIVGSSIIGTGGVLSFGHHDAEGTYKIYAQFPGCPKWMNGAVTVKQIQTPKVFTLSATNAGHFCKGSNGVTVSVAGQQLDYIYTLYRNGISTGQTFIGIVDDDNAVFTFTDKVVDAGSYTVVAQDPIVGCSSETDEYIISMDLLPVPVLLPTEPLDFCEGSYASFTFVPENGVEYELLDENGLVVIPASASGVFSYDQPGTYRVHAINTTTLCDIIYATDIVINPVRPLPDKTLNVDFVQGIGCDDGALITITNPQVDITYVIVDANNTDLQLGDEWVVTAPNYDSDLDGTPDQVQFNPVFDKNADYRIKAISEYGCESILDDGPIHVDVPGTVKKQQVVLPETMCMGDGGVKITLENSEPGVTYTLYFIENGNRIFKQDAVSIGGILEFKEPVYSEGIWSIEGVDKNATIQCPNLMIPSEFEIRFNPLPISYKLDANSGIYCDPAEAKIVLENSEYGIEYYLMRKMANGLYDFVEKQMGNNLSGGIQSLSFTPKKDDDGAVIDGTYMVYAKNPETGCTSNMENIVEVEQRNAPGAFSIQSVDECSADGMLTVEMTGFEAGVTYTVTNDANPPVVVFEGEVANSAFTKLPTGNYSAVASWNGQCASDPVTFAVNAPVSPATPVATISSNSICGSSEVVSITEPAPISDLYYGVERSDDGAATWTINKPMQLSDGTPIEWNDINDGTITNSTFRVVVSNYAGGECGVPSKEMSLSVLPQPIAAPVKVEETTNCTADGKVAILIQGNEAGVIYTVTDNKNADAVVYSGLITSSADADDWYVLTRVETGNYKISANWATNMSCGIDLNTALPVEAPSQPTAPAITINGNSFAHEVCGDAGTVLIQFKEGSYDPTLYYSLSRKESNGTITTTLPAINDGSGWDVSVGASTGDIYWVNAFTDASNTSCVSNNSNTVLFTQGIAPSGTTIWAQDLGYCIGEKGVQIGVLNPDLNEVVYRLVRVISEVDGVITFEHVEYLMTNSSDFTKYQYTLDNDPNYPSTAYLPFKNYVQAGVYAVFASYPYGDCSSFVEMNNRLLVFEKDVSDCSKLTAIDDFMFLNGEDVSRSINVFYDAETATDLDIRNPDIDFYNTEVEAPNLEFVLLDAACYEDQECKASRKDKRGNDDPFFGSVSLNKKTGEFIYTKVFGFYGTETIEYIVRNLDFPDSRVDTATITIMVGNKDFHDKGTLLIPNAFSPNDDDYNDTFIITGNVDFDEENNDKPINISDNNVFSSLEVYNRWGSLVYKSKGGRYGDEKAWWDGKGNAGAMVSIGSDLPNGTYFYIFKVSYNKTNGTPKTQHYNGFVELKR
ncbi:gliding motility-associated C-terminal domain-containing protein [Breznakibacter xylanolyticus]|uniref:gliding motility-associated C-terminal domain-containing protein n=1 Tax=Breznakibacter xylanolyticus TaxID=990 RepID=UPI000DAB90BB|nr:gliding motility-associated C-terminal domain-containing protein [Breznakibacter xylanolyticus]